MDKPSEFQNKILEDKHLLESTRQEIIETFKKANQKVNEVRVLKSRNRIDEQTERVAELKQSYHKYRQMARMSGLSLKTVHNWCSKPKEKIHKSVQLSQLRRKEFESFLLQDAISFEHPSKKFRNKRFLCDTLDMTRKKYLQQSSYHKYGVISMSTMKKYRPPYIMLCNKIPLDQCLCDKCENFEQILKTLHACGLKEVPANRYHAVDLVLCSQRVDQIGSDFAFAQWQCIYGECDMCGEDSLRQKIIQANEDVFNRNRSITWRKWMSTSGNSAPQKCQIKGTIKQATSEMLGMLQPLKAHLFRENWNRNIFEYIRHRDNLQVGYVVQIFDFAMNFRNFHQFEVQAAYWNGTQTSIHAVINYFKCPKCPEVVTLVLAQITEDPSHDSFVARAAHDAAFRYLAEIGIPLDIILQFCDNCSSQYKSRRPFAEMARCALNIIPVYFGEKHGKSQCDGFFGRLKAWMTHRIKSGKVIINTAHDFFRYCQDEYETPAPADSSQCQHYRVKFQFLRPSDIQRHTDCDLDKAVTGTLSMYSVRNTIHPLRLKVCMTPCLCPPCIADDGQECYNAHFTDKWREVELVPVKGDNKRKHMKRKDPRDYVSVQMNVNDRIPNQPLSTENDGGSDDDDDDLEIPEILENSEQQQEFEEIVHAEQLGEDDIFIDLTEGAENVPNDGNELIAEDGNDSDVIITKESQPIHPSVEILQDTEVIPDHIYWESKLAALERCSSDDEFKRTGIDLSKDLKHLRPRKQVTFLGESAKIDRVASSTLPEDGPQDVLCIMSTPDGNCLCCSLSYCYSGSESMHLEIRARIVIEGIVNKKYYTSHEVMSRGATIFRKSLPYLYVEYSDYYLNGQKITQNTVDYIYLRELHDCCKINSYMGLWQIAQASSVLNMPIQSVYPTGGDELVRQDFHRLFFPVNCTPENCSQMLMIMWTSVMPNCVPNHFVPLIKKSTKYAFSVIATLLIPVRYVLQH